MISEVTDHKSLIQFYLDCGIEFQSEEYVGIPIFSYIVGTIDNFIAAVTVTRQNSDIIIDDLAVHKDYRHKGYGKMLLQKSLERIASLENTKQVYIITKEPKFFSKYGFNLIQRKDAPDFSICFQCDQFQKKCFPSAMVKKI